MFKTAGGSGARSGILTINGSELITPTYFASTRRGAIPHLTPDNYPAVPLAAVYNEDFHEALSPSSKRSECFMKRENLVLNAKGVFSLSSHHFGDREKKVKNDVDNNFAITLHTMHGGNSHPVSALANDMVNAKVDFVVVPHDSASLSQGSRIGKNRVRKMETRTLEWIKLFRATVDKNAPGTPVVATINMELSTPAFLSSIDSMVDGYFLIPSDSRLADNVVPVPDTTKLRICGAKVSYFDMLDLIGKGIDVLETQIDQYSEAGVALTFDLNCTSRQFSIDLNDSCYTTDMSTLGDTRFAKAYLHHLLNAREMTAQVALQKHNLEVVDKFFSDIRNAIEDGTFDTKAANFKSHYD